MDPSQNDHHLQPHIVVVLFVNLFKPYAFIFQKRKFRRLNQPYPSSLKEKKKRLNKVLGIQFWQTSSELYT